MTRNAFEEDRLAAEAYARRVAKAMELKPTVLRGFNIYVGDKVVGELAVDTVRPKKVWMPPKDPATPVVRRYALPWSPAVRYQEDAYCIGCAPRDAPIDEIEQIEANSVWDCYPQCVVCGAQHTYVRLEHETCSNCNGTGIDHVDGIDCPCTETACSECGGYPCTCEGPVCGACGNRGPAVCDCLATSYRR